MTESDAAYEIISFDIFDTLIHRKSSPELVILGVAKKLKELIIDKGYQPKADLVQTRHDAHYKIMCSLDLEGLDEDLIIQEWAPVWVEESIVGEIESQDLDDISADILRAEIDYEKQVCYANPWMHKTLHLLKDRGVRLIAISDMYLGEAVVKELLEEFGLLDCFSKVYVSGDYRKLKRSGKLFDHVKKELELNPSNWLHVGDNSTADGVMPRQKGINTWIINDEELHYLLRAQKFDFYNHDSVPGWAGLVAANYAQIPAGQTTSNKQAYGHRVLGPIFSSFIHGVSQRSRELGIKKVFFFAREGLLLKNLFERSLSAVYGVDEQKPEAIYLGISRLTVFAAAMHGYGIREFTAAAANTGHYSLEKLFSPLKLDVEFLQKIADENGLGDVTVPLPPNFLAWAPLHRFLDTPELKKILTERYTQANELLADYLRQEGFFDYDRVAVVDVGWSGQIQDNLFSAIRDKNPPKVIGFYMGVTEQAHSRSFYPSYMESILADRVRAGWSSNAIFDFVFAPEVASRAPHGTTIGYEKQEDIIRPVFKAETETSRIHEKEADGFISLLQQGILDYADQYFECCEMLEFKYEDTVPYANSMIERMVRYPSKQEAEWWLSVKNVSDLGSDEVLNLLSSNSKKLLFSPRKLRRALESSFWRYGLLAIIGGKLMQASFVALDHIRTLKHRNLASGEARLLQMPKNDDEPPSPNKSKINDVVESSMEISRNLYQHEAKFDNTVNGFLNTKPLSLRENVWMLFGHKLVKIYSKIRKVNFPFYDGVSSSYLLKRHFFAKYAEGHAFNKLLKLPILRRFLR